MRIFSVCWALFIASAISQPILAYDIADLTRLLNTNLCRKCNLIGVDLREKDLNGADLRKSSLREAKLSKAQLSGAILRRVDLSNANMTEINLSEAKLAGALLTGVSLRRAKLNQANLTHVDLVNADLTEIDLSDAVLLGAKLAEANLSNANLSGVNLSGADLSGANLTGADLTGAYLYGAVFAKTDLRKANFNGAKLTGINLTDANLKDANLSAWEIQGAEWIPANSVISTEEAGSYGEITSFDLNEDSTYLTSRSGKLYELRDGQSRILLDLSEEKNFINKDEVGLLSVVRKDDLIYISYAIQEGENDQHIFLVVDEYTKKMKRTRRILKIRTASSSHVAGTLGLDSFGKLYLSVGDGGDPDNHPQNLQSLLGKILRIDLSKTEPEPEIVAFGLRNPWKFSIDTNNRMFIGDVGWQRIESVYLLEDLYPNTPYNLGWPAFEGTTRVRNSSLRFEDTLPPIFEYKNQNPLGIAVIGGFYLNQDDVYLFGDLLGNIRLLRKEKNNKWHEIHFQKMPTMIWSLGYDPNSNRLYMSGAEKIYELKISNKKMNRFSSVIFCRTTMPNGITNNREC